MGRAVAAKPAYPAGVQDAMDYAHGVLGGTIVAPQLVHMACKRFVDDLALADSGKGEWEYRPDLAERAMIFAGLMKNIKGPEAGMPLRMIGWQKFFYANVFGFVERGTDTRRFRQAIVYVPRGNGKTTIAAPTALYLTFVDGEGGAEGYAAAVTRDQARILFDTAREMVKRSPEFRKKYGVEPTTNTVVQARSASLFKPVSSDAKALDGLNVQVTVCDEIASHKTSEVYDVMLTAMGKRKHPFLLSISTATGNNTGIGKQLWDYGVRILEGGQTDDRVFAMIFTADPDDDPWEEATWIKVNPSWGQAVQPDNIRAIMRQARNNPSQEAAAKTRHLNIWVGADEALFSTRALLDCANPALSMDDFRGHECHIGMDLASKTDLAAVSFLFPSVDRETGRTRYTCFVRAYVNEEAVLEARNASYPGWAAAEPARLIITPGNETDFDFIERDVLEVAKEFRVLSLGYDPWQATQMSQHFREQGINALEFRSVTQNFSPAIIELDAAIRGGRFEYDGNPVLEWCIGNVVGKMDRRGNLYPTKNRPENKIDAAIATIMAVGRSMSEATEEAPSYQMMFIG